MVPEDARATVTNLELKKKTNREKKQKKREKVGMGYVFDARNVMSLNAGFVSGTFQVGLGP